MQSSWLGRRLDRSKIYFMEAISSVVWFCVECQQRVDRARSSSHRETPAYLVDVSMANNI